MKAKQYTSTLRILLDILNRLYLGEGISTSIISSDYGVTIRTAQRYIKYLKDAGFNLTKKEQFYYIDVVLDEEKEMLFEAINSIAKNSGVYEEIKPILKQLKLISEENVFYSKTDIEKIENLAVFRDIERAIKNKNLLKITYKTNKTYTTTIKPLKISNFEGFWYLNALNISNKYKTYHLKSIQKIEILKENFEVKEEILKNLDKAINIWFDPTKEPFLVELFVDKSVVKYFERKPISPTQQLIKNDDGSAIMYLTITDEREIIRILKMWIPEVRILSPKSLKEKILNDIEQYLTI
jgi:predicted DNA-binding transcriptional regulator YafY